MNANTYQIGGDHYQTSYQYWDLVICIPLGYLDGNSAKYVSRWRKKGGLQDLHKAMHYLDKLMEVLDDYKYTECELTIEQINNEVEKFCDINKLGTLEKAFIGLICAYNNLTDLQNAKFILEDLIKLAEDEERILTMQIEAELEVPGSPADGGQHGI
jgi:hypothetical protein